ncbi:MAG: copper chaperone PCu(A)C [Proteobacteria bacterium]|nr:copper chaperone PCu(A)C [Pseudomonadota bacterium]
MSFFKRNAKKAEAPSPPAATLGAIEFRKPWARASADVPGLAGAYLSIINTGTTGDRLVRAESKQAATAELCGIKVVGPNIEMRPLANGLALPGGESRDLKPRGYHVLLSGVTGPLPTGSRLSLTLHFEKAGAVEIGCVVEAPGAVGEAALDTTRQ